jgi:hypothetical protein
MTTKIDRTPFWACLGITAGSFVLGMLFGMAVFHG